MSFYLLRLLRRRRAHDGAQRRARGGEHGDARALVDGRRRRARRTRVRSEVARVRDKVTYAGGAFG